MTRLWTWTPLLAAALWLPLGCSSGTDTDPDPDTGNQTTTDGETTPPGDATAKNGAAGKNGSGTPAPKTSTPKASTGAGSTAKTMTVAEPISDLAYIPPNAAALLSFRPQSVLQSEMVQMLGPNERMQLGMGMGMVQGMTGVDPNTIERLSIVVWPGPSDWSRLMGRPPGAPGPEIDAAAFIRVNQPVTLDQIKQTVAKTATFKLTESKAGEVTYAHAEDANAPPVAVAVPNENLIVIGTKGNIGELLSNKARQGGLLQKVAATDMDQTIIFVARMDPVREDLRQIAAGAPKLPDAPDAEELTDDLDGLTLTADLDGDLKVNFQLDATEPETVQELKQQFDQWRGQLEQSRGELVNEFAQQYDQELAGQVKEVADQVFESLQARVDGDMLNVSVTVPQSAIDLAKTMAEIEARQSALRNQVKQLVLALHNYHDVNSKFPFPGVVGEADAKPLLSWRVAILPYLDEMALYDQFKLDEPWDSEHNKALVEQMPDIFKVSDQAEPGQTQFLAVSGQGMIIDGTKQRRIADVTDGTSNTIWMVTVKPENAVPWTKPDDLQVDPSDVAKAMQKLGGVSGGFLAGFVDGRVLTLDPKNLQPETFKKLVQIADGQVIDRTEYDPAAGPDGPAPDFGPDVDFPALPEPTPSEPADAVDEAPPTE